MNQAISNIDTSCLFETDDSSQGNVVHNEVTKQASTPELDANKENQDVVNFETENQELNNTIMRRLILI